MIILNELSTELLNRAAAKREARSRAYLALGSQMTRVSDNLNRAKKIRAYATKKHAQRLSPNGKPLSFETPRSIWQPHPMPPKSNGKPPLLSAPKYNEKPLSFETPRSNWQPHPMPPDGKLLPVAPKSTSKPPRQESPKSNGLQIAAPKSNDSWLSRNKGKVALGIGVGTAAAYGIHRYMKNKKKKEEESKRQAEAEAKKKTGIKRFFK